MIITQNVKRKDEKYKEKTNRITKSLENHIYDSTKRKNIKQYLNVVNNQKINQRRWHHGIKKQSRVGRT
ncbi:MAG: hypothetical protein HPY60_08300 [Candidatus Methanofastidiosum sp.]|nr:hypothetical protein [Methanofastidiosum sp.]